MEEVATVEAETALQETQVAETMARAAASEAAVLVAADSGAAWAVRALLAVTVAQEEKAGEMGMLADVAVDVDLRDKRLRTMLPDCNGTST